MTDLTVLNTPIRTHGTLYCLNDLHKAAGGEERHQPNRWLRLDQAKELIEEIKQQAIDSSQTPDLAFEPIQTLRGGKIAGTYACKELVYAYAMWISAKFHLHVIRAFDALVTGRVGPEETLLPSEQRTLMEVAHKRVAGLPDGIKGKALAEIWSRVHNKFRVAKYNQLPRTRLADAIVYITQMDLKCAQEPEPEYLTSRDMANLRKVIGLIVSRAHYEGAWQYAIWKRLRYLCDCPAPNRFEVRHLPIIAAELKRIWAAEEKMYLFFGEVSKRVARNVVSQGGDIENTLKQSEDEAARLLADMRNQIGMALNPWEQNYLNALERREALLNLRDDLEKLGTEKMH